LEEEGMVMMMLRKRLHPTHDAFVEAELTLKHWFI